MRKTAPRPAAAGSLLAAAAAVLALSACSTAPTIDARQDWVPDGNGHYVHAGNGHVISDAQYTEIVAVQVRNLVGARAAKSAAYCPPPGRK